MSSLIGFLTVITILVFIHEYGHYIAARLCGVKVTDFSIGFGPTLIKFKDKNSTNWRLCAVPLGGYVKMYGDLGPASNPNHSKLSVLTDEEKLTTFAFQPLKNRAFIVSAGPLANFLLAIVIYSFFNFTYGKYTIKPIISETLKDSPAYKAGIKAGDRILSINDSHITSFTDISNYIVLRPNFNMKIKILRDQEELIFNLISGSKKLQDDKGRIVSHIGFIGIKSDKEIEKINYDIFQAVYVSFSDCYKVINMTLTGLKQMIFGERSINELRGTITIAEQSGKQFDKGPLDLIFFIALISINLGIVNLLPIPVLDGGHLLFYSYEAIFGKKLSQYVENILYKIGFTIIIFLFVISLTNDIKAIL